MNSVSLTTQWHQTAEQPKAKIKDKFHHVTLCIYRWTRIKLPVNKWWNSVLIHAAIVIVVTHRLSKKQLTLNCQHFSIFYSIFYFLFCILFVRTCSLLPVLCCISVEFSYRCVILKLTGVFVSYLWNFWSVHMITSKTSSVIIFMTVIICNPSRSTCHMFTGITVAPLDNNDTITTNFITLMVLYVYHSHVFSSSPLLFSIHGRRLVSVFQKLWLFRVWSRGEKSWNSRVPLLLGTRWNKWSRQWKWQRFNVIKGTSAQQGFTLQWLIPNSALFGNVPVVCGGG